MNNNGSDARRTLFQRVYDTQKIALPNVILTFGVGHPFDLVKTRMQANPAITSGVLCSQEVFQKTGIRGFYTGGTMNFSRHLAKMMYRTPLENELYYAYKNQFPGNEDAVNVSTGLSMAVMDSFIICPLERIKVWLMTTEKNRSVNMWGRMHRHAGCCCCGLRFCIPVAVVIHLLTYHLPALCFSV